MNLRYLSRYSPAITLIFLGLFLLPKSVSANSVTVTGTKLTISVNAAATLTVAAIGAPTSYTFTLSTGTWSSPFPSGVSASGTVLTVNSTGLSAYDMFEIVDDAANVNVTMNGGTFDDNFIITLDYGLSSVGTCQFSGTNEFLSNNSISVTTHENVKLVSGATLHTINGNVTFRANVVDLTTTGSNFTGSGGVSVDNAVLRITGSGVLDIQGRGASGSVPVGIQVLNGGTISGGTTGTNIIKGWAGGSNSLSGNFGVKLIGNTGSTYSSITTSGGDIEITGFGQTNSANIGVSVGAGCTITAGGTGNVTVSGTASIDSQQSNENHGVLVEGSSVYGTITSGGGNVTVTGTGGGAPASTTTIRNYGVYVKNGGIISAGGTGAVNVTGYGGGSANIYNGYDYGVFVSGGTAPHISTITSSGGDVTVTGIGGNQGVATKRYSHGVCIGESTTSLGIISSGGNGNVTVTGTGTTMATTGYDYYGVNISGTGSLITSGGAGLVTVHGTGGAYTGHGINMVNGAVITSGADGSVAVTGIGGGQASASSSPSYGILADASTITCGSGNGTVTVNGTGGGNGSASTNYGVRLYQATTISSAGNGTVTVTGTGGNATGSNNFGVSMDASGTAPSITSGGGNIIVNGMGGNGTIGNTGVIISKGGITAGGLGNVTVTGTGGNRSGTSGASNLGVSMPSSSSLISSNGGNVSVTGTGGGGGLNPSDPASSATDNQGVYLYAGATITAGGSGTVTVHGTGGNNSVNGTGTNNYGVWLNGITWPNPAKITSAGGDVTVTGIGGGNGNVKTGTATGHGVFLQSGGTITSDGANAKVTVTGTAGTALGGSNYGVSLSGSGGSGMNTIPASIRSGGGDIVVTGTGGVNGTSQNYGVTVESNAIIKAEGSGTVIVTGQGGAGTSTTSGDYNYGVRMVSTSTITSNNGNVTVTGTGGGNPSVAGGYEYGVSLQSNSVISAGGTGHVHVAGTGGKRSGAAGNYQVGVALGDSGTQITSSGGNVTVIGTGGGGGLNSSDPLSTGANNYGVWVNAASKIIPGGSGTVSVTGTGGNNSVNGTGGFNYGVFIGGISSPDGASITSSGGNVTVNGRGGGDNTVSGGSNYGVLVQYGVVKSGNRNGTVTVNGTGGNSTGTGNYGVKVFANSTTDNTRISSGGGNVTVTGTGGTAASNDNYGVHVSNKGTITSDSSSGHVVVTGTGGGTSGSGNTGVYVLGNYITSTGGNVTVTGTGAGFSSSYGVHLTTSAGITSGTGGSVVVTGTGGSGNGGSNHGIYMISLSTISSGGGGTTVTGIGGSGVSGIDNSGLYSSGFTTITSAGSGVVRVTGRGGTGAGTGHNGILNTSTATITSGGGKIYINGVEGPLSDGNAYYSGTNGTASSTTNGGNIIFTGNSLKMASVGIRAHTADSLVIVPHTSGVNINLGAITDPATGPLSINSDEFSRLSGKTVVIGSDTSGTITISQAVATTESADFVLVSPAGKGVYPTASGTDITLSASKKLSFKTGTQLRIALNGTTSGNYDALAVSGNIDLSGSSLILSGSYTPVVCDMFTIVSATNLTGTFTGLAHGDSVAFNGRFLRIFYSATAVTLKDSELPATTVTPASQTVNSILNTAITATSTLTSSGFSGTVTYSVSPSLPAGLSLNASTGVISGTPTSTQSQATYYVIATGSVCGLDTAIVNIGVNVGCPVFTAAPGDVTIVNSACTSGCALTGGTITAPANSGNTPCPSGSSIEYQVNAGTWTTTLPVYDQDGPTQTIKTRCSCDGDNTQKSPESAGVTTAPGAACVYPVPVISVTESSITSNDGTICSGNSVMLTGSGGATYLWNTAGTAAALMVSPSASTTYTITVTAANGCTATTGSVITVFVNPTAAISGTTTICNGASTTLTASGAGAGTYAWANSLGSNAGINVSPVTNTTYTVTVTDGNGCTDTETSTVTVNTLPTAVISGSTPVCPGGSNTLTASGGTSYAWSTGGNNAAVVVTPASTGSYTVTVTDGNGCTDTETETVTIYTSPVVSIVGPTAVCSGGNTTLTATGGVSYVWNGSLGTNPLVMVGSGSYSVTATDGNGCTGTAGATVTVYNPPVPVITDVETSGSASNDGIICAGADVTVTGSGGVNYAWSEGQTTAAFVITPYCTTSYELTVTDANGCTGTAGTTVFVNYTPVIELVSPTSGSAGTTVTVTGTNLSDVTDIRFNGVSGTNLAIISSTEVRANLPSTGALSDVTVFSPCGDANIDVAAPVISSFTPGAGPVGTLVTVTGDHLDNLSSVTVGGVSAAVVSNNGTVLVLAVMPGSVTGSISVISGGGSSSSQGSFTVSPTPYPYFQQGGKRTGTPTNIAQQATSLSASADGNTVIIGAPADNNQTGAAFIFVRTGSNWSQQGAKLVGSSTVGASRMGASVAMSADGLTAAVGGPGDNGNTGAVWVFRKEGNTWTQPGAKLVGTGASGASQQGTSVAISGDGSTIATGAISDNDYYGAAWVFVKSVNSWLQQGGKIIGPGAVGKSRQGASVALGADGNLLIVGGYQDNNRKGAAWVYTRNGCDWTSTVSKLVGTGGSTQAWQAYSVSLSSDGKTAVLGAPNENALTGGAWVFTRTGGAWSQQGALLSGTVPSGASRQGISIGLSADGNTAIIGGMADDANKGAAWVFTRTGSTWTQQGAKLKGTGAVGAARQGASVALNATGTTALIGGPADNNNKGAFWVYSLGSIPSIKQSVTEDRNSEHERIFTLEQSIPNPSTGLITIGFTLPEACTAEWTISDLQGRIVTTLRREYPAGSNLESFDLRGNAGVYYYQLKTPAGTKTRKFTIIGN